MIDSDYKQEERILKRQLNKMDGWIDVKMDGWFNGQ